MKTVDASDYTLTTHDNGVTIVTVRWQTYSVHFRFWIPPTDHEVADAVQIGRLRLGMIRNQIDAVTRRLGK